MQYTDRAMKALGHARDQAEVDGVKYVDTSAILMGLAKESECIAGQVLMNLDVTYEKVRDMCRKMRPA